MQSNKLIVSRWCLAGSFSFALLAKIADSPTWIYMLRHQEPIGSSPVCKFTQSLKSITLLHFLHLLFLLIFFKLGDRVFEKIFNLTQWISFSRLSILSSRCRVGILSSSILALVLFVTLSFSLQEPLNYDFITCLFNHVLNARLLLFRLWAVIPVFLLLFRLWIGCAPILNRNGAVEVILPLVDWICAELGLNTPRNELMQL